MNLIFDFGGVVFRWQPAALIARELPHRAASPAQAQALADDFFQGYGGDWGEFDRGTVEVPDLVERISRRLGLTPDEVRQVVDNVPGELQPIEPTVQWLGELKAAGHRLLFLSNMPAPYADHLERAHDFLRWFDDGIFSARVRLAKPAPAIFEHALGQFGLSAGEALFFDDHPANVAAATALGLPAVQFRDAAQARDEARRHGLSG